MQQVTSKIKWLGLGSFVWLILFIGGLCRPDTKNAFTCQGDFLNSIGDYAQFFLIFPFILLILSLVLYFSSRESFDPWFRFARIYLLIVFVLIILAPATGEYGMGFSLGVDQESTTWTTAILFLLISLIIIIRKSIQLRRLNKTTPPSSTSQPK